MHAMTQISPFPGMDPYLEQPDLWSDFHNNLASEIQSQLNRQIQPRYFARLIPTVTYEDVEIGWTRAIRPDVSVSQSFTPSTELLVAAASPVATPVESEILLELPLTLFHIEIRTRSEEKLVTVIEILSPVNKRPRYDAFDEYLHKRRQILRAPVHLLEIDLLRGGKRPPLNKPVPDAPYYITLSRVETRPRVQVWPMQLRDTLPVVPVPLLSPDPDASINLSMAVVAVYERAAYGQQIDYREPVPPPRLSPKDKTWVQQQIAPIL